MSINSDMQSYKIKNQKKIYILIALLGCILASLLLYLAYTLITKDKIKSDNPVKNNRNKNEKLTRRRRADQKEIANRMRQEEQMQGNKKQLDVKERNNQELMKRVAEEDQARKSGLGKIMIGVKNMGENVIEYGRKAKKDTEDTMDSIGDTFDGNFEAGKDKLGKPIKSIESDVKKAKKKLKA